MIRTKAILQSQPVAHQANSANQVRVMSFESEEYRHDHIIQTQNSERWVCPGKNWCVLGRFLLGGTSNDPCSDRSYVSIANLNRHIRQKHKGEGIPQQEREYLSSFGGLAIGMSQMHTPRTMRERPNLRLPLVLNGVLSLCFR